MRALLSGIVRGKLKPPMLSLAHWPRERRELCLDAARLQIRTVLCKGQPHPGFWA